MIKIQQIVTKKRRRMKYTIENISTGKTRSFSTTTIGEATAVVDEFGDDIASKDADGVYHIYVGTKFRYLPAAERR